MKKALTTRAEILRLNIIPKDEKFFPKKIFLLTNLKGFEL